MSEALTFQYWFWPNPGNLSYGDTRAIVALVVCALLVAIAMGLSVWRRTLKNPVTKKLTRSWPTALTWFGLSGLLLVVSRVEPILFLAMRVLWVAWVVAFVAFVALQLMHFRARHYTVLPRERVKDARDPYLPRPKKK